MDPCSIFSIIEPIITLIKPIKPHIDLALRKRRYREALENNVGDLALTHRRLNELVSGATRSETTEIHPEVVSWLKNVEGRKGLTPEEYESLAQQRCFFKLCPNFITRYQLNCKAEKEVIAIDKLLKEAAGYGAVENIARLPPPLAESAIFVGDYESFQSREIIVQRVVDDLTVSGKSKVGVYGMGGSGKTTLAKVVANEVMKKPFDFVVFCKVTAVPDIKNIQKDIMEKLGLKITEENPDGRARRLDEGLQKMLEEKKQILFVLDDLWKKLKLEDVGIPSPDQHKGCQILMTSRRLDLLSNEMGCDKNVIPIGLLTDDEARELFMKMSGNNFENNDALRSKAHEVAKACARLPVAIVAVARALKNKTDLSYWETALLDLQSPNPSNFSKVKEHDPDIREDVHKSIYLSYKLLDVEELKSTLLLCSQLPNNSTIRDLLRYSWGLRLLPENRMGKVEDAQHTLRSWVEKLQGSCLLLDTGSNERIALHDVVRVITQAIASEEYRVFTRSPEDDKLTHLPDDQNCTRMWLRCKVDKLPEKLGYRQLELFHMENVSSDLKVPDGIFKLEEGQRLKVLSLTNFSCPLSLPSSLESLKENLGTLCLDGSRLEETAIAIIGELKNLEILSFAKCKIGRLPEEIKKLNKLKILDLSDCSVLKEVPRDVISSLSLLEELYMGNSFSGWEKEGGAQASLAEVAMLRRLSNLEIAIPDAGVMVENLFSEGLKRYRVTIGTNEWWYKSYATLSKLLLISLDTSIDFAYYGIQKLLTSVEVLRLGRMKGAENMLNKGFPQLKHLKLEENFETQFVVDAANSKAFPALESLFLGNLDSLEEICHGEFSSKPFPRLAAIEVRECHNLKHLFSFSIAKGLSQLKSMEVSGCTGLKGIVSKEDDATDDKIEFSELRSMVLFNLPGLKKFCYKMQEAPNSSGKALLEQSSLFDEKIVLPKLEELELESINMKTLWHAPLEAVKSSFQKLRRLSVAKCHSIKYVFTSSMVGCLVQLESLSVRGGEEIEEIIQTEEALLGEEWRIDKKEIVFSKLDALYLWELPKLKRFCSGYKITCPDLKKIRLYGCDALKTFVFNPSSCENKAVNAKEEHDEEDSEEKHQANARPLFDEKVYFPSLADLEICRMDNLEEIWNDQHWNGSFWTLRTMANQDCEQLLNIVDCARVEEIVAMEKSIGDNLCLRFPNLSSLILRGLPKLKNLYPGMHTSEWPVLERLVVNGCHAVKLLFPEFPISKQVDGDGQPENQIQQPLACRSGDIQLEKGEIIISATKGPEVWYCDSLFGVASPSACFQSLTTLEVHSCNGLTYIMLPSTAKSLCQLERLIVSGCTRVSEIVGKQDGKTKDDDGITFSKLKYLELVCLESLTNFCSGSYTFTFPDLEDVIVEKCPRMSFFSSGLSCTPKLKRVWRKSWTFRTRKSPLLSSVWRARLARKKGPEWKGDLNSTIQHLFKEMNERRKHQDNSQGNVPQARKNTAGSHSVSGPPLPQKLQKEIQEATPSDTKYETSPLSHQSLSRDAEMPELREHTEGEGVQHAHSVDSQAVDAPLPSVVFPADAEAYKTGQTVPPATLKTVSEQPIYNFDASQEKPILGESSSTRKCIESDIIQPLQEVPQSIPKQAIEDGDSVSSRSQKLDKVSETSDIPPPSPVDNSGVISASSSTAFEASHSASDFQSLFSSIEQILHPNVASSHAASISNAGGTSKTTFSESMDMLKGILQKTLSEVARTDESLLLLPTLQKLKSNPLLNCQQLEIIEAFIENFDDMVTYYPSYEQQIGLNSGALGFSMEDGGSEWFSRLKTLYEDSATEISKLDAEEELLKKRLVDIEERKHHVQTNMEELYEELVKKKGKMESRILEAARRQKEAEKRATKADAYWAKFKSLFE